MEAKEGEEGEIGVKKGNMGRPRTAMTARGAKVKAMVEMGATYKEVEKKTGARYVTVKKVMKDFAENKELIEWYNKHKLGVLQKSQADAYSFQQAILDSFSNEDLSELTPMARAKLFVAMGTDFGIKYDKERLEKNMSTENVAHVIGAINEWRRLKETSEG